VLKEAFSEPEELILEPPCEKSRTKTPAGLHDDEHQRLQLTTAKISTRSWWRHSAAGVIGLALDVSRRESKYW